MKRGSSIDKRTKEGQLAVLLSIFHSKFLINSVLSANSKSGVAANFTDNIVEDLVLCSDGSWSYVGIDKEKKCDHKRLNNGKIKVIDKVYHIQTVNGAIAHFKSWVNGKMKGVTTKYLSNYLAWFR